MLQALAQRRGSLYQPAAELQHTHEARQAKHCTRTLHQGYRRVSEHVNIARDVRRLTRLRRTRVCVLLPPEAYTLRVHMLTRGRCGRRVGRLPG